MYAVTQEAVLAELTYRRMRASDELHHSRKLRALRRVTGHRAAARRVG